MSDEDFKLIMQGTIINLDFPFFSDVPTYEYESGKIKEKGKKPVTQAPQIIYSNDKYILNWDGGTTELSKDQVEQIQIAMTHKTEKDTINSIFKKMFGVPQENDQDLVHIIDADGDEILVPRHIADKMKQEREAKSRKQGLDAYWKSSKGEKMMISDMKTSHLFNSLRLVFNQLVPSQFRIDVKDAKNFTATFQKDEGRLILKAMFHQIGLRDNLTDAQFDKLQIMANVVRKLL